MNIGCYRCSLASVAAYYMFLLSSKELSSVSQYLPIKCLWYQT